MVMSKVAPLKNRNDNNNYYNKKDTNGDVSHKTGIVYSSWESFKPQTKNIEFSFSRK